MHWYHIIASKTYCHYESCYRDSDKYTIDIPLDSAVNQVVMAVDGKCMPGEFVRSF